MSKNRPKTQNRKPADKRDKTGEISNPLFVREDWTLFRNLNTLGQKAGASVEKLPRLIVKELVDNALP